jgi:hypothetical protein
LEAKLVPAQPEFDVFISYSSRDKQWVRNDLLNRIESAGLRVFIDFRDFRRGAPSIKEMERAVTMCRRTILVLTPAYLESEWCDVEGAMESSTAKLTKMRKEDAEAALVDLPDAFAEGRIQEPDATQIEIRLFEFREIDRRVFHPAILILGS